MWKKKAPEPPAPHPTPSLEPQVSRPAPRRIERAVIGPTIRIQGEVKGQEELLVQGRIEGRIEVNGQGVTVGKSGKIRADIHARSIRVEGEVRGNLFGEQEVIIEASGDVEGNLIAPSVRLENGSRFKGSIDMEQDKLPSSAAAANPTSAASGMSTSPSSDSADTNSQDTRPQPGAKPSPLRP